MNRFHVAVALVIVIAGAIGAGVAFGAASTIFVIVSFAALLGVGLLARALIKR